MKKLLAAIFTALLLYTAFPAAASQITAPTLSGQALPAELKDAIPLCSAAEKTLYSVYKRDKGDFYLLENGQARHLGQADTAYYHIQEFAVLEDRYAYACFPDLRKEMSKGGKGRYELTLARFDLKNGSMEAAATFFSDAPQVAIRPAGDAVLIYGGRVTQGDPFEGHAWAPTILSNLYLYRPAAKSLSAVVSDSVSLITAACFRDGDIYAVLEQHGAKRTSSYRLARYSVSGQPLETTDLNAAAAQLWDGDEGSIRALDVWNGYVKLDDTSTDSILFHLPDGHVLYRGERLTQWGSQGDILIFSTESDAQYRFDSAAGVFQKTIEGKREGGLVDAYVAMVDFLAKNGEFLFSDHPVIAFDVTNIPFADGEKAKFFARMREIYGDRYRIIESDFNGLDQMGYIGGMSSFYDGALATISGVSREGRKIRFSIQDFVSGDGANYFEDYAMEKVNGIWTVTEEGGYAIS